MARERVIVKRLDAIEDFGAMSVLCTDKTGTMTVGTVELAGRARAGRQPQRRVAAPGLLNAKLQTGFANPIDDAIVAAVAETRRPRIAAAQRLDELPYDFTRQPPLRAVADGEQHVLVTKGAFADVLKVCTSIAGTAAGDAKGRGEGQEGAHRSDQAVRGSRRAGPARPWGCQP